MKQNCRRFAFGLGLIILIFFLENIALCGEVAISKGSKIFETSVSKHKIGMKNPAAVYCRDMGYDYKIVKDFLGEHGLCTMPDKTVCPEWDFLSGKCAQKYSFCAKRGYGINTLSDGGGKFSKEYAVCTSGKEVVGKVVELADLVSKSIVSEASDSISTFTTKDESLDDTSLPIDKSSIPPAHDWRNYNGINYMTPAKNQGDCASCWAFGAVSAVEAAFNIQTNFQVDADISEQQLVTYSSAGSCGGGDPSEALDYVKNIGLSDEQCLPYAGVDNPSYDICEDWFRRSKKISGYSEWSSGNPYNIKYHLVNSGPVMVDYYASSANFGSDGILRCNGGTEGFHEVVIIGYNDAGGYWIIKNSWGTDWGEEGYGKVAYGECEIEKNPISVYSAWSPMACNANERYIRRLGAEGEDPEMTRYSDEMCLPADDSSECLFNREGYSDQINYGFFNLVGDTNSNALACVIDAESNSGVWYNLDYSRQLCEDGGYRWRSIFGDANSDSDYRPTSPEWSGDPRYYDNNYCSHSVLAEAFNGPSKNCCCGDDDNENYSISPIDGTGACCQIANSCVKNGVCQGYAIETEICGDGVDNDCDGLIDCKDTDCMGQTTYNYLVDLEPYKCGNCSFDYNEESYAYINNYYLYGTGANGGAEISFKLKAGEDVTSDIYYLTEDENFNQVFGTIKLSHHFIPGVEYQISKLINHPMSSSIKILAPDENSWSKWTISEFRARYLDNSCGSGICEGSYHCDYSGNLSENTCTSFGTQIDTCLFCGIDGEYANSMCGSPQIFTHTVVSGDGPLYSNVINWVNFQGAVGAEIQSSPYGWDGLALGNWSTVASLGTETESYADSYNDPLVPLCYRVRTYDWYESYFSNESCTSLQAPAEVPSLSGLATSSSNIKLSWSNYNMDAVEATSIEIKNMSQDPSGPFQFFRNVGYRVRSADVYGLNPDTQYCLRIRQYNAAGITDYSNIACVETRETEDCDPTKQNCVIVDEEPEHEVFN